MNSRNRFSFIAIKLLCLPLFLALAFACRSSTVNPVPVQKRPLITTTFTADPSAHVFEGKIYIYPSHDRYSSALGDNSGGGYDMVDYHVFSLDDGFAAPAVDHGVALDLKDVPWASKQAWAPDAAYKNGTYYLYFPAKDKNGLFRIGVAVSKDPAGPFTPDPEPIKGSYSVDPAVFVDDDGQAYMYFGGLGGGQLERYGSTISDKSLANAPRVVKMAADMRSFDGEIRGIRLLDRPAGPDGPGAQAVSFFEAPWMHKYQGKYYFSYSSGTSHLLCYAVGDSPFGPFTYRGVLLTPVQGWTTHHSIIQFQGKWYLFYHDSSRTGQDTLRCVKYQELHYTESGDIVQMSGY
jgi:hypothetical protein